ncbi:MAG: hypothetical protein RL701_5007 [Pseudomonadota bacterium]|jgi:DNA-binding transcriptional regulator GbsR (MarR family)
MGADDFSELLGRFFESNGLPRVAGRVLGHLLTCAPAEQTFDELVAVTAASRSTVSVASRLLVQLELVERFGIPGERRDRYRLREDAWTSLLKQDVSAATQLRKLAQHGLKQAQKQPATVRARLKAMRDFFIFLEGAYTPLLASWEKQRTQASRRGRT